MTLRTLIVVLEGLINSGQATDDTLVTLKVFADEEGDVWVNCDEVATTRRRGTINGVRQTVTEVVLS